MKGVAAIITQALLLISLPLFCQRAYDLQLALQTAKANNPVLKSRYFHVKIAETDIITARLRPNPVLNNQSLQLVQPAYFPATTDWSSNRNKQIWWQVTKPFQLPQLRKSKIEFAEYVVHLEEQVYRETEDRLLYEVAGKWIEVWTDLKHLGILGQAKDSIDNLTAYIKLRSGQAGQTDLVSAELLSGQYDLQIHSSRQNYRNALESLKWLMGVKEEIKIDTSAVVEFIAPGSMDALLQQALLQRADILALKSSKEVAGANIKLQRALAWPSPELGAIYNPQNTVPYLGFFGTIHIPVFSRNQGEIKKSYLLMEQSEQNLSLTQFQLQVELSNSFNTYQTEKSNLKGMAKLVAQTELILNTVKQSCKKNETSIHECIEAQKNWLEIRQQYYEEEKNYRLSYIQLLYTSGLISQ